MSEETRVVLVKPGDVLLIGNLGGGRYEGLESLRDALERLRDEWGIQIAAFSANIDIDLLKGLG